MTSSPPALPADRDTGADECDEHDWEADRASEEPQSFYELIGAFSRASRDDLPPPRTDIHNRDAWSPLKAGCYLHQSTGLTPRSK